jgi:hypothetical protein
MLMLIDEGIVRTSSRYYLDTGLTKYFPRKRAGLNDPTYLLDGYSYNLMTNQAYLVMLVVNKM